MGLMMRGFGPYTPLGPFPAGCPPGIRQKSSAVRNRLCYNEGTGDRLTPDEFWGLRSARFGVALGKRKLQGWKFVPGCVSSRVDLSTAETMHSIPMYLATGFVFAVLFASFFEWTLHRFLMHKPFLGFSYAYQAHALVHHKTFNYDHTYHLVKEEDKWTIPMAWWNGPVLIMLCMIPVVPLSVVFGGWWVAATSFVTFCGYYGTYEYLHWCMHLPKARRLEKSWVFRRLNAHHLLHHRYMGKNFNVVLPLADLLLGSLILRSKVPFMQPRGPAVPDVQPLQQAASHA